MGKQNDKFEWITTPALKEKTFFFQYKDCVDNVLTEEEKHVKSVTIRKKEFSTVYEINRKKRLS